MPHITTLHALEVLDSRGNPTIAVTVTLDNGAIGRATVPSGASTGEFEAYELRDNDTSRFLGKGVQQAVANVNNIIAQAIIGVAIVTADDIDSILLTLDDSTQKTTLGANSILGVSMAIYQAMAQSSNVGLYRYLGGDNATILPVPMMNILNGGAHADNPIDIQEFMIMPIGAPNFNDAIRYGVEVFHCLKSHLKQRNLSTNVGDEGGFAPRISSSREALDLIVKAITDTGLQAGRDIMLALDCASSEFYHDDMYHLKGENITLSSKDMGHYLENLCQDYPIFSIEDGCDENDWQGWQYLTQLIGDKVQLVGDDLFVTNTTRLQRGIDEQSANAILIKPNQIGTIQETTQAVKLAQRHGLNSVMSHRSGESEDTIIADLAVGLSCGQIKTGAPSRADRTAKYNRLLHINHELGADAIYGGAMLIDG